MQIEEIEERNLEDYIKVKKGLIGDLEFIESCMFIDKCQDIHLINMINKLKKIKK